MRGKHFQHRSNSDHLRHLRSADRAPHLQADDAARESLRDPAGHARQARKAAGRGLPRRRAQSIALQLTKGAAAPLPDDALNIAMRGPDKADSAAVQRETNERPAATSYSLE